MMVILGSQLHVNVIFQNPSTCLVVLTGHTLMSVRLYAKIAPMMVAHRVKYCSLGALKLILVTKFFRSISAPDPVIHTQLAQPTNNSGKHSQQGAVAYRD